MILKEISLRNFRNFRKREFIFSSGANLVVGPNMIGKTNLLEAIYLLSCGESLRAGRIEEMVEEKRVVSHIESLVERERGRLKLRIVLTRGMINGKMVPRRQFFLDGVKKTKANFVGNFLAVVFRPEDLDIIIDSPSVRRSFLNEVLVQSDREYYRSYLSYRKGLSSRNKVLESIREGRTSLKALFFWDRLLIENGELITRKREELISFLNDHQGLLGPIKIVYQKSIISLQRLEEKRNVEVAVGMTLVGPHRDDFSVFKNGHNLSIYGSRGEQRLAVLWLKMGQLKFLETVRQEKPVLLLDDIFSELDEGHRELVVEGIDGYQAIITSTDKLPFLANKVNIIRFEN